MERKIRVTVVALLAKGLNVENVPNLIEKVVEGEDPTIIRTLYKTAELDDGTQRIYIKISKVIDADEITNGWHLKITEEFRAASCADVAWKITEIDLEECEPEYTTASFPIELFQSLLEQAEDIILPEIPQEPFGSDAFWERFENDAK